MVDEIYDRNFQEGRAAFNDGLDRLFAFVGTELGKSFKAIHQFEWSAPWARAGKAQQR